MESFLGDLTSAQVRQGHEVAAIVHGDGGEARVQDGVRVYRVPTFGDLLYAPMSPGFPRWLRRVIRDWKPDVIHAHVPNLSSLWLLAIRRSKQIPWIIQWQSDIHVEGGPRRLQLAYQFYRGLEAKLLRRAAAIICSSPDYLAASQPLARWIGKARVVPLGIDPARITNCVGPSGVERLWPGRPGLRVLVVGRLAHYKGHRFLLHAVRQVSDVSVLVVGEGELGRELERLTKDLGVTDRVSFMGHTDTPTLNGLLHACDAVCLPSTARTESFGIVLLEAMVASKPVIASDVSGSGMPWVVRTAGHGLLAQPGSPESLGEALEAMKDPAVRERLGEAGARALRERFHIDRVATDIEAVYRASSRGDGQ